MNTEIPTLAKKVAEEKIKMDNTVKIPKAGFKDFDGFFPALSHTVVRLGLLDLDVQLDLNPIGILTNICIAQQNQIERLNNKVQKLCIQQHLLTQVT